MMFYRPFVREPARHLYKLATVQLTAMGYGQGHHEDPDAYRATPGGEPGDMPSAYPSPDPVY